MKNENDGMLTDQVDLSETLLLIRHYLESTMRQMNKRMVSKNREIATLRQELLNAQTSLEANKQLFNKLLGDVARLTNDIEWYKKTYEQRSFLGTIREKLFRKH